MKVDNWLRDAVNRQIKLTSIDKILGNSKFWGKCYFGHIIYKEDDIQKRKQGKKILKDM